VPNEACSLARDDDRVQDKEIITFTEIGWYSNTQQGANFVEILSPSSLFRWISLSTWVDSRYNHSRSYDQCNSEKENIAASLKMVLMNFSQALSF
jgi:hypothetical protein